MSTRSRILIGLAALSLGLMYLFPLWKISLEAPQYPEGIGLEIWIDTVKGEKQHDLANINNLNHYIGMKRIEPDTIQELKWMPWIIGFLMVTGLLVAAAGKRWMLYTWIVLFVGISIVGLVDFYLWEYDYGHNLDQETAIIKIPGMSYQPPLFGSKQLLNFVATSLPALGGIVAFLAMGIGLAVAFVEMRASRPGTSLASWAVLLLGAFALTGCTPGPRPLEAGVDRCEHCLMGVSDTRYGGEIVLPTGKVLPFDAVECLTAFLVEHEVEAHSIWVVDYANPGELLPAEKAIYARSEALHSPMGLNMAAFRSEKNIDSSIGGEVLDWEDVLRLVEMQDGHAH